MESLPVVVALAVFGVLAIIAGIIVWRSAEKIVEDARRELEIMFGDRAAPGGAERGGSSPEPLAARIAGAGFVGVGVVLVVVAAVLLLT